MKPNTRTSPRQIRGMTLMELLTVIGIIGILASVAVPAYLDNVRRGQVEEATAVLSQGRVGFEQYFLDNRTFVGAETQVAPGRCPADTEHFGVTCATTATTYTITATGAGALAAFAYTINERNQRTTASPWGNGACWIMKKGQPC